MCAFNLLPSDAFAMLISCDQRYNSKSQCGEWGMIGPCNLGHDGPVAHHAPRLDFLFQNGSQIICEENKEKRMAHGKLVARAQANRTHTPPGLPLWL